MSFLSIVKVKLEDGDTYSTNESSGGASSAGGATS